MYELAISQCDNWTKCKHSLCKPFRRCKKRPSFTRTCCQVRHEALPMFYSKLPVIPLSGRDCPTAFRRNRYSQFLVSLGRRNLDMIRDLYIETNSSELDDLWDFCYRFVDRHINFERMTARDEHRVRSTSFTSLRLTEWRPPKDQRVSWRLSDRIVQVEDLYKVTFDYDDVPKGRIANGTLVHKFTHSGSSTNNG
jgi:hypothetical protein